MIASLRRKRTCSTNRKPGIDQHDAGHAYHRGGGGRETAQRVGEADAVEQLVEGRHLLDADQACALVDQDLQTALVIGRGGGDRADIAADRAPDNPHQPAHDADRRQQRDRSRQAQTADPRLLEGVGQRIDHVPEHQPQDEG
jgi:hypothetical protein